MAGNINRVVLVGNLTRDPELRHTPSGTPVCSLRLAVNTRRKDESGQWTDKPNYFDITVWGQQGEKLCAVPVPGTSGRDRRPSGVARVGRAGRDEAAGRRGRRRERPVPGRSPGRGIHLRARRRDRDLGRGRLPDLSADDEIPF